MPVIVLAVVIQRWIASPALREHVRVSLIRWNGGAHFGSHVEMARGEGRVPRMIPGGQAPHNIHGAYEFVVKVQCNEIMDSLMIYDEERSFTIEAAPASARLKQMCLEKGIGGSIGKVFDAGKKAFFLALRDSNDILIFTDKVVP